MDPFDYTTTTVDSIDQIVDHALGEADAIVTGIVQTDSPESFEQVLAPLDAIGDLLTRASGTSAFMGYVHPDPDVREAGHRAEERISKWGVEVAFREDLYQTVKAYSETADAADLTGERRRLLEFTMRDFRRAGHELDADSRAAVKILKTDCLHNGASAILPRLTPAGGRIHLLLHPDHLTI